MPAYLLKRGDTFQAITSTASIGVNKVIRILKPPEDRMSDGRIHADADDYEEWKVTKTDSVVQEHPDGGFEDCTILTLERIDAPIPFEQRIIFGG
jgi:hypothetical protein